MARRILVLHGPNLNLLGTRPGDARDKTLEVLDKQIRRRAAELGLEVKILQSNHEGVLIDALHDARDWADAVLINPEALAHTSYVLREALRAVGKPAVEVHLEDIRRRESWRRKSVIKDVCVGQVMGKGFDSYLLALEKLSSSEVKGGKRPKAASNGARAGRLARPAAASTPAPAPSNPRASAAAPAAVKTLGRAAPAASGKAGDGKNRFLNRAQVRQKIADRLAGKLSPSALATWARTQWLEVQRGAPAESGQRETLEDALQSLVLSAAPRARMSDEQLIDLMAQLET